MPLAVPGSLPEALGSSLVMPEEFHLVDDFWDSYVGSLQHSEGAITRDFSTEYSVKGPAAPHEGAGAKPADKRRKRDSEANKRAQARFRERKKQEMANMERELEQLRLQLAAYGAVKEENEYLTGLNARLTEQIANLELSEGRSADISADVKLESRVSITHSDTGLDVSGGVTPDGVSMCAAGLCPASLNRLESTEYDTDMDALNEEFKARIGDIRALLEKWGVPLQHVPGEGDLVSSLSDGAREELWGKILMTCKACQMSIMASGPDVDSLLQEWRGEQHGMNDRDAFSQETPWQLAMAAMNLSSAQKKQILALRVRHLESMSKLYEERQRLNLLAMSMMVGAPEDVPHNATVEGRIERISSGESLGFVRKNAGLEALLDEIKTNLRSEQKAIMSFNCMSLTQLLDCVQASRYMILLYPMHCDALALANAIHFDALAHGNAIHSESDTDTASPSSGTHQPQFELGQSPFDI